MAAAEDHHNTGYTFEDIEKISTDILSSCHIKPVIGIICGSGLGGLVERVQEATTFPYSAIPGFPRCTVQGHEGKFVLGKLGGKPIVMMAGRAHFYEGYPMWKVAMSVRVVKAMGITTLIITNAAGGMNPDYKIGDVMMIRDHIDLPGMVGNSPLRGPNDNRFGDRFISTNTCYDKGLRQQFRKVAEDMGMSDDVKEGVYVITPGPTFINRMESKLLRTFGADAVGMSTVPEVIVAKHSGLKVFGFSLISDMETQGDGGEEVVSVSHENVLKAVFERSVVLQDLVDKFVATISH